MKLADKMISFGIGFLMLDRISIWSAWRRKQKSGCKSVSGIKRRREREELEFFYTLVFKTAALAWLVCTTFWKGIWFANFELWDSERVSLERGREKHATNGTCMYTVKSQRVELAWKRARKANKQTSVRFKRETLKLGEYKIDSVHIVESTNVLKYVNSIHIRIKNCLKNFFPFRAKFDLLLQKCIGNMSPWIRLKSYSQDSHLL